MDWFFKESSASCSWDLTELDRDEFDHVLDDMGKNQNMEVFSGDSSSMNKWNEQDYSTIPSSPAASASSKKVQEQFVSCLVDWCTADLSSCRDYYRRHRVCESHSKTPVVTIAGKRQRFCQQCSRFHSLGEFDDVKRSCRKRLDGHNRRRRKPRADSMYLNYESFFTNPQGTNLLRFGGSPAYAAPLTWPHKEKFNQQLHSNSYYRIYHARERKFPFQLYSESDEVNQMSSNAFSQQDFSMNASADAHLLGDSSERLTQLVEPKCALSLLSKHTIRTSESSLSNLVQPSGTALQFNAPLVLNQEQGQHLSLRDITGQNSNNLIGMIRFRSEGLLENEATRVLSFSWE